MSHDVFISYSHKDKPVADAVCATLENTKVRCWMAPRDILPGAAWGESIIDAINASRALLLVFTAHSNASPQVIREVKRAVSKGIPIIPVRVENTLLSKAMEYFISSQHWLDAVTPPLEQHLKRLSETVRLLLAPPSEIAVEPRSVEVPVVPTARAKTSKWFGRLFGKKEQTANVPDRSETKLPESQNTPTTATPVDTPLDKELREALMSNEWCGEKPVEAVRRIVELKLRKFIPDLQKLIKTHRNEAASAAAWLVLEPFGVNVLEDLQRALRAEEWLAVKAAVTEVGRRNLRQFTPELRRIVKASIDARLCGEAWRVLEQFGVDPISDLQAALTAGHWGGRYAAIEQIRKRRFLAFADDLGRLAETDPELTVRTAAIAAIAELDLTQFGGVLRRILKNELDPDVRQRARQVLFSFGEDVDDVSAPTSSVGGGTTPLTTATGGAASESIDPTLERNLRAALNPSQPFGSQPVNAVNRIGELNLRQFIPELQRLTRTLLNEEACSAAWHVLEKFEVDVIEDLRRALRSEKWLAVKAAVVEVGRRNLTQFTSEIRRIVKTDNDTRLCASCWQVLGQFGVDPIEDLTVALRTNTWGNRHAAVEQIRKGRLLKFADDLSRLARTDSEPIVRNVAIAAISELGLKQFMDVLRGVAEKDLDANIRQRAKQALFELGE